MRVEFSFDPDVASKVARRETKAPVNKQARRLALAYHIEALIASGEMMDIAHVARVAGVSRARVSQILDMTLLAPSIQEAVLDGSLALGSHALRQLTGMLDWEEQGRSVEK